MNRGVASALALCAWLSCAGAWAAPAVTELRAQDVAAFVAEHEYAVVQMTSPDRRCGYCVGADKIFDQAAALPRDTPIAFARVQWTPWRSFPDFGSLVQVYGVPVHFVFRNGKVIGDAGGKPPDARSLVQRIEARIQQPQAAGVAATGPAGERPAVERAAEKPDAQAMPLVRLYAREQFFGYVVESCSKLYAQQGASYAQTFQRWRTTHQDVRSEAGRQVFKLMAGGDDSMFQQALKSERTALQQWQASELRIPMDSAPRVEDCDRTIQGLSQLALPPAVSAR